MNDRSDIMKTDSMYKLMTAYHINYLYIYASLNNSIVNIEWSIKIIINGLMYCKAGTGVYSLKLKYTFFVKYCLSLIYFTSKLMCLIHVYYISFQSSWFKTREFVIRWKEQYSNSRLRHGLPTAGRKHVGDLVWQSALRLSGSYTGELTDIWVRSVWDDSHPAGLKEIRVSRLWYWWYPDGLTVIRMNWRWSGWVDSDTRGWTVIRMSGH